VAEIVTLSDVLQYVFGKNGTRYLGFGPSPHKTWEGYAGGVIAVMIGGWWFNSYLWSVYMVALGILGDLYVSSIKRRLRIKDTSSLLGSHGGWLDRTDGVKMAIIGAGLTEMVRECVERFPH
jgi:phosphatidate cytidylyltransferase